MNSRDKRLLKFVKEHHKYCQKTYFDRHSDWKCCCELLNGYDLWRETNLPDKEELLGLIVKNKAEILTKHGVQATDEDIAEAIAKRIGK